MATYHNKCLMEAGDIGVWSKDNQMPCYELNCIQ